MRPAKSLARPLSALALVLPLLLAFAPRAQAQVATGPFPVAVSWFVASNGTTGIFGSTSPDTLVVDVDGNGYLTPADTRHYIPTEIRSLANKRLSPSRRTLYAYGSGSGCTGTKAYFYTVPPGNNAPLQPLTGAVCIPNGVAFHGFFDQPGAWSQRIAFFVGLTNGITNIQNITWVDLSTGVTNGSGQYNQSVDSVWFAPSGIAAFVRHEGGGVPTVDYSVVNLCPGSLGTIYNSGGGALAGVAGQPLARAFIVPGPEVQVTHPSFGSPVQFPVSDCSTPPPGVSACCLPGGGCIDGFTQSQCDSAGGSWNVTPTLCENAGCPPPQTVVLGVSASGPASAPQNSVVPFTLSYSNTGNSASSGVTLVNQVPSLSTYVSSTPSGTYNPATGEVTWSLGTLAGGASGQVVVRVLGPCGVTQLVNGTYRITGTPGGTVNGTVTATTTLTSANSSPVTMQIITTPLAPEPLSTDQLVRYRIKLTNTVAVFRDTLRVSVTPGSYMAHDAVQSAGTGSTTLVGSSLNWTCSLASLDTTSLVFTTKVLACRPPGPSANLLNGGSVVFVRNVCSQLVGFASPTDTNTLAPPPWSVSLATTNLGPQQTDGFRSWNVMRPGGTVHLRLSIGNASATPAPSATISVDVPPELVPIGNPPFFGGTPPGATWDDGLKRITWTGTPAPHDTVDVNFRATLDPGACRGILEPFGTFGTCASIIEGTLAIISAPVPPAGEYLAVLTTHDGLRSFVPGTSTYANLLCMDPETSKGLARSPNGDFWIAGWPVVRYNPTTLLFRVYGQNFFQTRLDMSAPDDVAVDSTDTTVVFAGYKAGIGMRVRRYRPDTDAITTIWNEPSPPTIAVANDMLVDRERRIVIAGSNKVLRINPAAPNPPTTFTDATVPEITAIALDNDGNYVAVGGLFVATGPRPAKTLDRTSGVFTPIGDLTSLIPVGTDIAGAAVAPNGDVYVAAEQSLVGRLHRQPGVSGESLNSTPFAFYVDMVRVPGPGTVGVEDPTPVTSAGPVAFAPPAPNPSRGETMLLFTLPHPGPVSLAIYDVHGRRVRRLVDGDESAGEHRVRWDGRDGDGRPLGAGLYFATLVAPGARFERRIALIR